MEFALDGTHSGARAGWSSCWTELALDGTRAGQDSRCASGARAHRDFDCADIISRDVRQYGNGACSRRNKDRIDYDLLRKSMKAEFNRARRLYGIPQNAARLDGRARDHPSKEVSN